MTDIPDNIIADAAWKIIPNQWDDALFDSDPVFLSRELVEKALATVYPFIQNVLVEQDRRCIAVCILKPGSSYLEVMSDAFVYYGVVVRDGLEHTDEMSERYRHIAFKKANQAARAEMATVSMRSSPQYYRIGDTRYQGGVHYAGIPIGVSGLSADKDEEVAFKLGAEFVRLCKEAFAAWEKENPDVAIFE